ncbi:sensor histidine kinase [Thermomonospora umbrina]|uniref:sensor histidine kinase n=1 Tax=Thermomonospora umbrina TaxID=111806 RepID=UPI000E27D7DD|nr:ATP-binding protein [Thermomonospora umbrina]
MPVDEPLTRGRRRFARARTIRARLALVLTVPTVMLVAFAGVGVFAQVRVAGEARAVVGHVELVLSTQELIHALQRERGLTSGLLGGGTRSRPQVVAQRKVSDRGRAALDPLLVEADDAGADQIRTALGRLNTLASVRAAVDAGRASRTTVLDFYTTAITALGAAARQSVPERLPDRRLRDGLESLHVLGDAKESTALERGHLNGVFAVGRFTPDDYRRFTETRAARLAALVRFRQVAVDGRTAQLDAAQRTPQAELAAAYEERALAGASGGRLRVEAPRWWTAMTTVVDDQRTVQRGIGEDVRGRAHAVDERATRLLLVYSAGAAATVLLALLLWLYTFRSIVRPLRMLTADAREVAATSLPGAVDRIRAAEDPATVVIDVPPSSAAHRRDEFAEVATALDDVQRTAVRLAVEQAVLRHNTAESLANLGRRNQNLVRRQLGFISALEREEADPNALANLFELDHLATRMRRNAESLLVLVGEHSPRPWKGTVGVGDVLRAALGEVEDYRRVVLRRIDDADVRGMAAAEISHLLAELVENALISSPPDQDVEVQGRVFAGRYHIAIVDQGVGMAPEALATANARLRAEQSFLVAPTRDLGHYVVGRLAERLGIEVWLHDSPLNGVTARVVLPADLLETPRADAPSGSGATAGTSPAGKPPPPTRHSPPTPANGIALDRATPRNPPNGVAPPPGMGSPGGSPERVRARSGEGAVGRVVAEGAATTENGLVKRRRREGGGALRRPIRPAAPPSAQRDRSPHEVRSMLDALRDGVRNGSQPAGPQAAAGHDEGGPRR